MWPAATRQMCGGRYAVSPLMTSIYLGGELIEAERLRQEVDVAVAVEALAERVLGVARDDR